MTLTLAKRVADVNTTSIAEAIHLGCHTMQSVFNEDDNSIPFFRSFVYPDARLDFSPAHSESHVPGRHLNALLNAEDAVGASVDEAAIEKHRRAALFSYSGPVALPLNRQAIGGPLVNFCPHNIREGLHALYALVKYREDDEAMSLAERCIAAVFDLWCRQLGWDEDSIRQLGLNYAACQGFIHGEARLLGPLVKLYGATGYAPALELAMIFMEKATSEVYLEDGGYSVERFATVHTHSITCVMSSLAQLAELLGDARLLGRVKSFYDFGLWKMRDQLGWSPERALAENCDDGEMNNTGDILETALILGRHGFTEYFEDAERILRCHMLPAQLRDVSFIDDPPNPHGVNGSRDLASRHRGAFGFPAPYGHLPLGAGRHKLSFNMDVVGGTVGSLCEAYRDVTRHDATGHRINLLFDHGTDNITVSSPYTHDRLTVELKHQAPLSVRLPSWVDHGAVAIEGASSEPVFSGGWLLFAHQPVGVPLHIDVPRVKRELLLPAELHVKPIRVLLQGDAVAAMESFEADLTFFDPL